MSETGHFSPSALSSGTTDVASITAVGDLLAEVGGEAAVLDGACSGRFLARNRHPAIASWVAPTVLTP